MAVRARLSRPGAVAIVLSLLLLGGCTRTSTPDHPADRESGGPVDDFALPDLPTGSSGSLVAASAGTLVTCQGWGESDREAEVAAGCDTVYDIGSVTKQFTAAAVVKLQMQGRLRVSDPISAFLPGVPADKREITVRQLLTNTAGLVDSLGDDYEPVSRGRLIARALRSELRSPPGERYHYSNVGYSLLAVIVEEASGVSYERYLAEQLFAPAGMDRTGYVLPDWSRSEMAVEYDAAGRPQGTPVDHPWAEDGPYWNLRGNGGLLSTARDMFRWYRALRDDQVLDAPARAALLRPRVAEEPGGESSYAFGWVVMDTPLGTLDWHNGGNGWSYSEVALVPTTGEFAFWVTNQVRGRVGRGWNLEHDGGRVTEDVLSRLRGAS